VSSERRSLRRVLRLAATLLALLAALSFTNAGGHAAAGARPLVPRTAADAPATAQRRASPTPTPVVVPRRPRATPSPTPPIATVRSDDEAPPPPPRPTPTPRPTPRETKPAETIDDDDVIRVSSNLVVVPTSVVDASGNPVQGLTPADFQLEEEGRRQEIAEIGVAEQVPLDIALVFDVSSSTIKNFDFMKQAAAGFLREVMKPTDRAALFTIGERPRLVKALSSSSDAARELTAIPAADKPTGTAFYDTVTAAAKYLTQNATGRNRRVVLVITDGEDNFSDAIRESTIAEVREGGNLLTARQKQEGLHRRALEGVSREVQRADAVFYSINPSGESVRLNVVSQRAQDAMRSLADATGGSPFLLNKPEDLAAVFRRIAAELRAQYLLQYYSNTDAPPGKFLRIRVATPARADLRVRARQGYYSQQKK
jgi:Ca-activated chloride channel family protein